MIIIISKCDIKIMINLFYYRPNPKMLGLINILICNPNPSFKMCSHVLCVYRCISNYMIIFHPSFFTLPPLEGYQRIKVKIKRAHTYKGWVEK